MNSRLKLSILIVTTCFVVAGAIGIIAWAIAATNVGLNSTISVTYTAAQNVVCEASATYQKTTDTSATAFQSGTLNFAYGSATTSQTMTASSTAVVLNDTNTYVIFEYTFKNKNLMQDYRLRVQLTDNAVCNNMARKYYIGDLSSLTVAQKRDKIREANITNYSVNGSEPVFFTLGYQETGRIYMLLEITPGVMASYSTSSSHLFAFSLTTTDGYAVTCDPNGGYRVANDATYAQAWQKAKGATEPFAVRARNGYTLTGYILKNTHTGSTTDVGGATFKFDASSKTGTYVQGTVDCTLVAQWEPNTIKITLDKNGGTGGTDTFYYKYGINKFYSDSACKTQITTLSLPTKSGYTFMNYHGDGTSGGNENEWYFGRYKLSEQVRFASDLCTDIYKDATLTATWQAN